VRQDSLNPDSFALKTGTGDNAVVVAPNVEHYEALDPIHRAERSFDIGEMGEFAFAQGVVLLLE